MKKKRLSKSWDVIVTGAGHNGLAVAVFLAELGFRVLVLERREQVGGATITEQPWGHDYKVTSLSYSFGMAPDYISRKAGLTKENGFEVFPQHGYFAPRADGGFLQMHDDPKRRHAEISKVSKRDADIYEERWEPMISELASVLRPIITANIPRIGSRRLGDLWEQIKFAWSLRGLDVDGFGDFTRFMTMSVSDLLDDYFESSQLKGLLSVSGVIGTWAGPRSPGTSFVMAHHKIGSGWGFPKEGMGSVSRLLEARAKSFGAEIRTGAEVERILVRDGKAVGVALASGEEFYASCVVATTNPKITFLRHLDSKDLPDKFVEDIKRLKTRGGTVKINLALDRLPEFKCKPGFDPEVHGGTIVLAESVDDIEGAFQDAVAGRSARLPFADICIPSVFDPTLAPKGKHVASLFTQWVPCEWASSPHKEDLEIYADRVIERVERVAPGFTNSILHRQVIGSYEMEREYGLIGGNIFAGELSLSQIGHMRPAPGYADHSTPIQGLYNASAASPGGGGVNMIPAWKVAQIISGKKF